MPERLLSVGSSRRPSLRRRRRPPGRPRAPPQKMFSRIPKAKASKLENSKQTATADGLGAWGAGDRPTRGVRGTAHPPAGIRVAHPLMAPPAVRRTRARPERRHRRARTDTVSDHLGELSDHRHGADSRVRAAAAGNAFRLQQCRNSVGEFGRESGGRRGSTLGATSWTVVSGAMRQTRASPASGRSGGARRA